MELKNSEPQSEKSKKTGYTEEEILALLDFACTDSFPDFNNGARLGWGK
jgi:hypothetical protein